MGRVLILDPDVHVNFISLCLNHLGSSQVATILGGNMTPQITSLEVYFLYILLKVSPSRTPKEFSASNVLGRVNCSGTENLDVLGRKNRIKEEGWQSILSLANISQKRDSVFPSNLLALRAAIFQ